MRLTIGSGDHYAEGWVNIDRWRSDTDMRADVFALPFADDVFEQVYAGHVLEHLPYAAIPAALTEVRRVLRPGGRFAVVGPCIEAAVRTNQPPHLLAAIIADPTPETPGSGHEWTATRGFTLAAVRTVFPEAEAVPVSSIDKPEWPNPSVVDWQCAVLAA